MYFTLLFSKADKPIHRASKRRKKRKQGKRLRYFKRGKNIHLLLSEFLTKLTALLYQGLCLKLVESAVMILF